MPISCLYKGVVVHRRLAPTSHLLRYGSTYCLFDVDELQKLDEKLHIFSLNRWNLLSLHSKDLGLEGRELKPQIVEMAQSLGLEISGRSIKILHMPRILGLGFNPLTTYFFYGMDGQCEGIIYEVNNTFGEKHRYAAPVLDADNSQHLRHSQRKDFYVSPFFPESGTYDFDVVQPNDKVAISIKLKSEGKHSLNASFVGNKLPLTTYNLLMHYIINPFSGLKIICAIHWEALRLWLKGIPIRKRLNSNKEDQDISLEGRVR